MKTQHPDRMRRPLACRALALPLALPLFLAAAGTAPRAMADGDASPAAAPQALERRVKAAFLYKFPGHAEFPPQAFADPAGPPTIAVVGFDDMAAGKNVRLGSGPLAVANRVQKGGS